VCCCGSIPLVFIEGDPEKTPQVRRLLPDAGCVPWPKVGAAIRKAAAAPPANPLPTPPPDTPLLQKLGIEEASKVAVLHAPAGFSLSGARARKTVGEADVVMTFHLTSATLQNDLPQIAAIMQPGRRVWIVWPKKAGEGKSDLTMPRIREMAQSFGMTDYKVCAVDDTWSAMALGRKQR